jgi:Fic family protein
MTIYEIDIDILEMLKESNYIEQEYDVESLVLAATAWNYLNGIKHLNSEVLNSVHKILMEDKGLGNNCGNFRDCRVYIGNHIPPEPFMVPHLVSNWILDYGNKILTASEIKDAHVKFETIHPYVDGNGRIGRMLLNWQRHRAKLPTLVIRESEKQKYYEWFRDR